MYLCIHASRHQGVFFHAKGLTRKTVYVELLVPLYLARVIYCKREGQHFSRLNVLPRVQLELQGALLLVKLGLISRRYTRDALERPATVRTHAGNRQAPEPDASPIVLVQVQCVCGRRGRSLEARDGESGE